MQRSFRLFKQNFFQAVDDCRPVTNFSGPVTNIVCSYCALGTAYVKQFHDEYRLANGLEINDFKSTDGEAQNLETKHPESENNKINYDEETDLKWSEKIMDYLQNGITINDDGSPINWDTFSNNFAQYGFIHTLSLIFDHKKCDPYARIVKNTFKRPYDHLSHTTTHLFEALHGDRFGACYMLVSDYPFPEPDKFKEYAGILCGWNTPPDKNGNFTSINVLRKCLERNNVPMATFLLEQKASPDVPREETLKKPLCYAAITGNKQWTTLFYKYSEKKFSSYYEKHLVEYSLLPQDEKHLNHVKEEIAKEFKSKILGSNRASAIFEWLEANILGSDIEASEYDRATHILQAVQKAPNIQTISNIIDSQIAFLEGKFGQAFEVVGFVTFEEPKSLVIKRDLTHCVLYQLLNSIKQNLLSIVPNPHAAASAGPAR